MEKTMATSTTSRLTTPPIVTTNTLADIDKWLDEGDYVVVHEGTKFGRFFHKCMGDIKTPEQDAESLNACRVIYIDVTAMPGLLDDGEWNLYITESTYKNVSGGYINKGFRECTCSLKGRISNMGSLPPHAFRYGIPR
jgi:hypothetical protein